MVKLIRKKISMLQHRLNKSPLFTERAITRPFFEEVRKEVVVAEKKFYVAQMDASTATILRHNGGIVIRFCDSSDPHIPYPGAKSALRIDKSLTDFKHSADEELDLIAKQIFDFLQENRDAPSLHVHCQYGEIRSTGFVYAIAAHCPNVPCYQFMRNSKTEFLRGRISARSDKLVRLGLKVLDMEPSLFASPTIVGEDTL